MAVPLNYNPTPLTLLAGGTIRAMSGGGDGGAPPRYDPNPLTAYVNPSSTPINVYTGGGPNNIQHISAGAIATHEATTAATVPATAATSTNTTEASEKKQISLGGLRLSIGPPPWNLKEGTNEMEALAWFGVDKAPDVKLKEEVLDALYEGVCDTDKPLIMVLECEPIRRLVQSLAEKLLGNLTRPVVKKTSAEIAAIAEQQKKKAKLMSFNVFKNQCKTKTAKDYIDKSDADIVCTQQDTKTEFTNYTEIKACGDANSATRVYLRKNTPFKLDIECIEGDHSAAIFTYQGVTIVNMRSSNQDLLKMVLEKKPNIILGSVNDIVLSREWIRADTINKDLNTTEAIWYKKEDELFELKNTTVDNIKVKGDDYTKPELCSYSDHNPITAEIHFKKTLKQLASNADEAAKVAAASSQITSTPNSGIVSTLGLTPHMSSSTINQLTESELLQQNAAKKLEEARALAAATASAAVELDDELAKKIAVAAVAAMLQEDEEQGIASHKSARAVEDPDAASPAAAEVAAAEIAAPSNLSSTSSQAVAGLSQSSLSTPVIVPGSNTVTGSNAASGSNAALLPAETTVLEPTSHPATIVEPAAEPVAEPVTEPVTEPVAEPVTEPVAEPAAPQMPISSTEISTQPNSVPVEKIASAAAATVAALSNAADPSIADPSIADPSIAVPVAVEEISDELAKKIAVAAVAVMLQNSNQGSIAQSGIATSVTPRTHEQLLANSINGLNNQMFVNNEHNIVHYNEAPHENEVESSSSIRPTTPLSTSSSNNSPVVFHHAKNNGNNNNKPLGVTNLKTPSAVGLHSSASPTASQPLSEATSYNNELSGVLADANKAIHMPSNANINFSSSPITHVRQTNPPQPVGNGNNRLLTKTKLGSLLNRLKKNGQKLSTSSNPAVELEAEPDAEPTVEPTVKLKENPAPNSKAYRNLNALNAMASRIPKYRPQKHNPTMMSIKEPVGLKMELVTLRNLINLIIPEAKRYIIDMYNGKSVSTEKDTQLSERILDLESYLPRLKEYIETDITHQTDGIRPFIDECRSKIKGITGIIRIRHKGGKRQTQKKRKQKKQKKRFGTHKK